MHVSMKIIMKMEGKRNRGRSNRQGGCGGLDGGECLEWQKIIIMYKMFHQCSHIKKWINKIEEECILTSSDYSKHPIHIFFRQSVSK